MTFIEFISLFLCSSQTANTIGRMWKCRRFAQEESAVPTAALFLQVLFQDTFFQHNSRKIVPKLTFVAVFISYSSDGVVFLPRPHPFVADRLVCLDSVSSRSLRSATHRGLVPQASRNY